jgi:hypothetical protein
VSVLVSVLQIAEKAKAVLVAAGHIAYIPDYDASGRAKLPAELNAKIKGADVLVVL